MIRNLLWAGAGAVLAGVAIFVWGGGTPWDPKLRGGNTRTPAARSEPGADAERPDDPNHRPRAPEPTKIITEPAPAPASADKRSTEPLRVQPWSGSHRRTGAPCFTDIPNRRANDDKGSRPATDLLDAARITCDFGPGSVAGARVGDSLSVFSGAQYQGSLMVYDVLEPSSGKARLTGTAGAVGSPSGETNVRLMTIGSRIQFMGLLPNGTCMLTTVYDELDSMDRHVAVMSRHENALFNYGAQFLGVCY